MTKTLKVQNLYEQLQTAPLDPAVGIRVIPLVGDDSFTLFAAEIGPRKRVGAHYHAEGLEIYQIVEGAGIMHIGQPLADGRTRWLSATPVKTGDCFMVGTGEVHQLVNLQDSSLIALFGCPRAHLSSDRFMAQGVADSAS